MLEKRLLVLILILFMLLGGLYALTTPVFEASDELWHYPMIRHLADGNPLPVQVFDPAAAGPWKQEASQPPLYYYVGAALTFWIDTSDMEQIRWLNPHVDNGVITEDGNNNLVIHDPAASPWQGTLLAVRIVRLVSVLMGAATVYLTYRIAGMVAPGRPEIALGAAAVSAFLPMFLFISGAVNNDNLAIPLASLSVFFMIQWIVYRSWNRKKWLLLGTVIGLAALTKEGTLGLLPLAAGTVFVAHWQVKAEEWRFADLPRLLLRAALDFALLLVPVLLVAGWWYLRNIQLYGDLLGWNAFIAVLGERPQPASLAQLWDERWGFLASYWGLFGGVNVPMASWIYLLLNGILVAGTVGFLVYLAQVLREEVVQWSRRSTVYAAVFGLVERRFPLIVCLLFSAAVVYGLINWATTTWSSQGRLVFTAISSLNTLLLLGLVGWLPRRPAVLVTGLFGLFLFLVAAAAPFLWIRPAYQPPVPVEVTVRRVDEVFGDRMRLAGYHLENNERVLQPGDDVELLLVWEALTTMERDWSVFIHLNDPVLGTPLVQRDRYPGQGLLATSLLEPGQQVVERYHLRVPATAVAPSELELAVGLYDYDSPLNERLPLEGGTDALVLETLSLVAAPGEYPNATTINFGDKLELVGYRPDPRQLYPGETMTLTTYWRALETLDADYTLFAQVLNELDTTRWASSDIGDAGGGTMTWKVGEVQMVTMPLTLREDSPAGVYPIIVGAYRRTADGGFQNLQIVEEGRITMNSLLTLTRIRIEQ